MINRDEVASRVKGSSTAGGNPVVGTTDPARQCKSAILTPAQDLVDWTMQTDESFMRTPVQKPKQFRICTIPVVRTMHATRQVDIAIQRSKTSKRENGTNMHVGLLTYDRHDPVAACDIDIKTGYAPVLTSIP